MLLAQEVAGSSLSSGLIALYPLAVLGLGALVKWWMRGTERSVEAVAASVADLVKTVGGLETELARQDERLKQLRAEHDRLHQWKNEFVESIGADHKRRP